MKNTIKFLGIIALAAVIGFSMAACGGGSTSGGASEPFEVTANASGEIEFRSGGQSDNGRILPATVTTDLPAPNNSFTLQCKDLESKIISGLTPNQKVTGEASCSGDSIAVTVEGGILCGSSPLILYIK